jgi:hypothetical protein
MLQTYDGAGIYTVQNTSGGTITGNVIYNAHDNNYNGLIAAGIMLDNYSANWTISNNITSNVDAGFKANMTSYNEQIYGNQFGGTQNAMQTNGWTGFQFDWSGSNVHDNVFYNSNVEIGTNAGQWNNTYSGGSPYLPPPNTTIYTPAPPAPASPPPPPPPAPPVVPPPPPVVPPSPPAPPPPTSSGVASSIWGNGGVPANDQNVWASDIVNTGGAELGLKFTSDVAGFITGVRFWKSSQNTGTHSGELWDSNGNLLATATFSGESSSDWQQVNFSNAVAISANTTYIVSYHTSAAAITYVPGTFASGSSDNSNLHAPSSGASGGNGVFALGTGLNFPNQTNGQSPSYGVDVVFSTTGGSSSSTPTGSTAASIFGANAPAGGLQNVGISGGGVELGTKFQSSVAGSITGVEFWKGSLNTGTHTAELWSGEGKLLAQVTFNSESSSGWQQVFFSSPVSIAANVTYTVSYHTNAFSISYTPGMLSSAVTNGSLKAVANGAVFTYGSGSLYPNQSNGQSAFYWVDPLFQAS